MRVAVLLSLLLVAVTCLVGCDGRTDGCHSAVVATVANDTSSTIVVEVDDPLLASVDASIRSIASAGSSDVASDSGWGGGHCGRPAPPLDDVRVRRANGTTVTTILAGDARWSVMTQGCGSSRRDCSGLRTFTLRLTDADVPL